MRPEIGQTWINPKNNHLFEIISIKNGIIETDFVSFDYQYFTQNFRFDEKNTVKRIQSKIAKLDAQLNELKSPMQHTKTVTIEVKTFNKDASFVKGIDCLLKKNLFNNWDNVNSYEVY